MWEDWKLGDRINVGDRFNVPGVWGHPDHEVSIVTEVTEINPEGIFSWVILKPDHQPYTVGHVDTALRSYGWKVLRAQRDYVYDQTGDTDDDI